MLICRACTGASDYGVMHASEIISQFSAEQAVFKHKVLMINVNRSATDTSIYEATRCAWKLSKTKAEEAEIILSTVRGLIVAAFVADEWLDATTENFPILEEDIPGRFGFHGKDAPEEIKRLYVNKSVPNKYRKPGAANPVRYTW